MPKLTSTQRAILGAAAERQEHAVLPLPSSLKLSDRSTAATLKALLRTGLLSERTAAPGDMEWRKDKDGRGIALIISDSGLAALRRETSARQKASPARRERPKKVANGARQISARTSGGKSTSARMLGLLRRPSGATVAELQKVSGWQSHSVRAALTGFRKGGITIGRQKNARGETVYKAGKR